MVAVRKHTLSIGSKWSQTLSQIGLSHELWKKAKARHCETPFRQALGPRPPIQNFHTLQDFVQRNNWIFEVLFPKCQSCLVSSFHIVFTREVVVSFCGILGCLHFPEGSCFFGPPVASSPPTALLNFIISIVKLSPVFSFDTFVQRLTECVPVVTNQGGPHLSFSMWRTLMHVFTVPTSSTRSVNSSGPSLTVTPGNLLILLAFVL